MAGRWRKGGRLVEVVGAGHSEMDDWEGLGAVTWHVCPPWRGRPARRGLLERPGAAGGSTPPFLYTLHSSHASPSPITPAQRLTGFHLSSHCHYTASFTVTPPSFRSSSTSRCVLLLSLTPSDRFSAICLVVEPSGGRVEGGGQLAWY